MTSMTSYRLPNETTRRYPVVHEQLWCTVPKGPADPEPHLLSIDDDEIKGVLIDHISMNEDDARMFVIWIPVSAGKSPATALGSGYTLIFNG